MNTQEFEALNGLNTEVIILDAKDLSVIWLNDSAKAANWIPESSAHELKDIFSFIDDEAENQIKEILLQAKKNASAITRRDFMISDSTGQVRTLDLTISYADKKKLIYIEALSTENLNKIIDSTRIFSTQKIAAGLARTLAHEVKNPLSGIKGSAQILKSKYSDDFSKKFLKIIEDETDRLNEIVTKILTPAKKPSFAYFNLHETLQRVLALTNAEANDNLNIARDYDPSIPEIYGDKNLFIQAVINIVQNALQACSDFSDTPQLGIKTHIAYRQPINGNIHATLAEIEISDNGPGIDSELHDQIFFPMVSSKESGSGIGLSIAQDIIRIHGGAISFDRKNNQTIFSILIPISNNIQKAQSA
ncbi:ATP-binding protein [Gammaproteobacteria bacterium]|nr:ATP-binding protein [Gammaproteobacteria bacterium]MDC3380329.1 ATP-binding protein [Gammaproteobacteria bacterium]